MHGNILSFNAFLPSLEHDVIFEKGVSLLCREPNSVHMMHEGDSIRRGSTTSVLLPENERTLQMSSNLPADQKPQPLCMQHR